MAPTYPARVAISAYSIKGDLVTKTFFGVTEVKYDFFRNMVNIVDTTGSFYFAYNPESITHVVTNGVTIITIV